MSTILFHSEVLPGQNHRNLNCVSMHIFGIQNPKICIETQFKCSFSVLILAAREILYTDHLKNIMLKNPGATCQGRLSGNIGYYLKPCIISILYFCGWQTYHNRLLYGILGGFALFLGHDVMSSKYNTL